MAWQKLVVINFDNQHAHKIAIALRLLGYHSEILSPNTSMDSLKGAAGIILSDGIPSIHEEPQPAFNQEIFSMDVPVLGIGYGHQLLAQFYGGKVGKALIGELGTTQLTQNLSSYSPLFLNVEEKIQVAVNHRDEVLELPPSFEMVACTKVCRHAAIQDLNQGRFGFQFNIESKETSCGNTILQNFAHFCGMEQNWDQDIVMELMLAKIRFTARDKKVLIFLSGGVDSNVAYTLLNKALGQNRVLGIHIDNGFMRKNESKHIAHRYWKFGFKNFVVVNASESFLKVIGRETDPQRKRALEAAYFHHVCNKMMGKLNLKEDEWLVALNTLYSDNTAYDNTRSIHSVIPQNTSSEGVQALINKKAIIEPLKELYKDEVRLLGRFAGLRDEMICRHSFPEPGLSINVLCSNGELSHEDEQKLAQTQIQVINAISKEGSQSITATVLPVKAVRIKDGARKYDFPVVLAFDASGPRNWLTILQGENYQEDDESTELPEEKQRLQWYHIPRWRVLDRISSFITDSVEQVSRVVVQLYQREGTDLRLQEGYCDKFRLDQTREVDKIVLEELKRFGWYEEVFQHFTINLPYATDPQHCSIVLRPVDSEDVVTARFVHLNHEVLSAIMERLVELPFVDAVYYDVTNKPPAAFCWE